MSSKQNHDFPLSFNKNNVGGNNLIMIKRDTKEEEDNNEASPAFNSFVNNHKVTLKTTMLTNSPTFFKGESTAQFGSLCAAPAFTTVCLRLSQTTLRSI